MGIIKATATAIRGAAADQWKEAFCAGEMGSDLLMTRAKRLTGQHSSNEGSNNVITDGSTIIVGEGECALATEGGKIIGIYDQPGEQRFNSQKSSGIFGGGVGAFFKDVGRRISFGGDAPILHRLFYINTKELTGGTIRVENMPLRYKDSKTGLDMDGCVSCYGSYTFRIADPERFYKKAIQSTNGRYRKELLQQMDCEVLAALAPALAQMTQEGIRPCELLQHTDTLCRHLQQIMSDQWSGCRGIEVFSLALESFVVQDLATLNTLQHAAVYQEPTMAAGLIIEATATAMQTAAANKSGAFVSVVPVLGNAAAQNDEWKCVCGCDNKGAFCTECGTKNPASMPQYRCGNCGWQPEDRAQQPKFCPECGKPFGCRTN